MKHRLTTSRRTGLTKTRLLLGALLWSAVFLGLMVVWRDRTDSVKKDAAAANDGQTAAESGSGPELASGSEASPNKPDNASMKVSFPARRLPDFSFDECLGGKISLDDMKGKRWVASFVFTRCTSTCPTISRAMMDLHDRVVKDAPEIKFVSFTVDPKYDTVEVMKNYATIWTTDHENWKFLTGDQQQIYELIVKGFGLYVAENLGQSRLPGFEVAHSNRVVLVNEDGIPVGTFLGTSEEDMVKLRRILTGRDEFPVPGPGLSISTTDGAPVQIQFQIQPVEDKPEQEPVKEGDDKAVPESDADSSSECDTQNDDTSEPAPEQSDSDSADSAPPTDALPQDALLTEPVEPLAGTADAEGSIAAHNALIEERLPDWARQLPTVNASLNSLAAILLLAGLIAIKRQKRELHRNLMITAFLTSVAFLASYLLYHYALGKYTGEHGRKFSGSGLAAVVYPFILWPHVILAMFVPVLAIRVFQHAFSQRWDAHKRLARITFPIWMFVSITGVIIYEMLYHWPWFS